MLVSLKSLNTQGWIHLAIKDILASLSAFSGLPCTFQFSFTGPMKEVEQNFPRGNAAWLYEQSPFHFRGNQVVFQWVPVTKLFYCYNIMKQFLFCARQGAQSVSFHSIEWMWQHLSWKHSAEYVSTSFSCAVLWSSAVKCASKLC